MMLVVTYEVTTNGKTVWINRQDGRCVARHCPISDEFGTHLQLTTSQPGDYATFRDLVKEVYALNLPEKIEDITN